MPGSDSLPSTRPQGLPETQNFLAQVLKGPKQEAQASPRAQRWHLGRAGTHRGPALPAGSPPSRALRGRTRSLSQAAAHVSFSCFPWSTASVNLVLFLSPQLSTSLMNTRTPKPLEKRPSFDYSPDWGPKKVLPWVFLKLAHIQIYSPAQSPISLGTLPPDTLQGCD